MSYPCQEKQQKDDTNEHWEITKKNGSILIKKFCLLPSEGIKYQDSLTASTE